MTDVWPLTGVGTSSNWSFAGNSSFDGSGAVVIGNFSATPGTSDIASLTGSALTTLDAAITNGSSCAVTLKPLPFTSQCFSGTMFLQIRIKGGTWTSITIPWSGGDWASNAAATVIAGSGSGFEVRGGPTGGSAGDTAEFNDVDLIPTAPAGGFAHSFGTIIGA